MLYDENGETSETTTKIEIEEEYDRIKRSGEHICDGTGRNERYEIWKVGNKKYSLSFIEGLSAP